MLLDRPCRDLLQAFSDPTPTPGGGSAAALAAALGASLLAMVSALPRTRSGSDEERRALDAAREALLAGRDALAALVEDDTAAFDAVMAAYRLPKSTDEEKRLRSRAIQEALDGASAIPLEVMRRCQSAMEVAVSVGGFGSPMAASDVAVAVELLQAAAEGARRNVEINLGSLKDARRVEQLRQDAATLTSSVRLLRDRALRAAQE